MKFQNRGVFRERILATSAILLGSVGISVVVTLAGTSAEAAAPQWQTSASYPMTPNPQGVSCGSAEDCVAVAGSSVLVSTDGGGSWSSEPVPTGIDGLDAVSCSSGSDCIAVGAGSDGPGEIMTTLDGGYTWTDQESPAGNYNLTSVSCASPADCVAVGLGLQDGGNEGIAVATTNGGINWTETINDTVGYASVSCASTEDCVVVGADVPPDATPAILATSDGGTSWSNQTVPAGPSLLNAVSCASTDDCIAVDNDASDNSSRGYTVVTTDGGAIWSLGTTPGGQFGLNSISCASMTSDCIAVGNAADATAAIVATTNEGKTWTFQAIPVSIAQLDSVSCSSALDCVAADGVIVSTANGGQTWTNASIPQGVSGLQAVACPTMLDCTAVNGATILGTTDGGSTWTPEPIPVSGVAQLTAISCPTTTDCVVVGSLDDNNDGVILVTTDQGDTWSNEPVPSGASDLAGVSCASPNDCFVAGGLFGTILASTNGGGTWVSQPVPSEASNLDAISCPTISDCVATGTADDSTVGLIITTTDGGAKWSAQRAPSGSGDLTSVDCPSGSRCYIAATAVDNQGTSLGEGIILATDNGGVAWASEATPAGTTNIKEVACPSSSRCFAIDALGSSVGFLGTSDGGQIWNTESVASDGDELAGMACPSISSCTIVGQGGTLPDNGGLILVGSDLDPPAVAATSLSSGTVGAAYAQTVSATGGTTPYVWSLNAGTLPPGLSLDGSTGVISGTPTTAGIWKLTVEATDANGLIGSIQSSITIARENTLTTVVANPVSAVYGAPIVYSADVTTTSGVPSGTVSFQVAGSSVLCAASKLSAGVASCRSTMTPAGAHSVTATYSGDADRNPSSGNTRVTVAKAHTSLKSSSSPTTVKQGGLVTYSATVTSSSSSPTGFISFAVAKTALCRATLTRGRATCKAWDAPLGVDTVEANYSGTANYLGSSSVSRLVVKSS